MCICNIMWLAGLALRWFMVVLGKSRDMYRVFGESRNSAVAVIVKLCFVYNPWLLHEMVSLVIFLIKKSSK